MNLTEVNEAVAEKSGLSRKDAAAAVGALIATITEALTAGTEVRISGLGGFAATKRPARKGRNPRTGEEMTIPERTVVQFKPAKPLSEAVNP